MCARTRVYIPFTSTNTHLTHRHDTCINIKTDKLIMCHGGNAIFMQTYIGGVSHPLICCKRMLNHGDKSRVESLMCSYKSLDVLQKNGSCITIYDLSFKINSIAQISLLY